VAALAAAALASGCGHAPVAAREPFAGAPIRALPPDAVKRRVDAAATEVTALRGGLDLAVREAADGAFRSCRGALAARSPWAGASPPGIYLQGHRSPLPTLFTLVSDGRAFWLHVPREGVVYTGAIAGRPAGPGGRAVPLEVRDLFRGLFVQPLAALDDVAVTEEPGSWLVSVRRDGAVRRRAWVDRRGLVVRREVFLDAAGNAELTVERDRWRASGGRWYPRRVVLTDGATGGAVRLEFDSVELDPRDLDDGAFRPRLPAGARVERVGEEAT
jgi:hypothetical protein